MWRKMRKTIGLLIFCTIFIICGARTEYCPLVPQSFVPTLTKNMFDMNKAISDLVKKYKDVEESNRNISSKLNALSSDSFNACPSSSAFITPDLIRSKADLEKENTKLKSDAARFEQIKLSNKQQIEQLNKEYIKAATQEKKLAEEVQKLKAELSGMVTQVEEAKKLQERARYDANQLGQLEAQVETYMKCCESQNCLALGTARMVHMVAPPGEAPFAYGWTVIQRRLDGKENFARPWVDYQRGFGDRKGEFFLGLEELHRLTQAEPHELYIHLEDFRENTRYARYSLFKVGSVDEDYKLLSLGEYSGNAGNALIDNLNQKFSTYDHDNEDMCANQWGGGWWYDNCGLNNLNGEYLVDSDSDEPQIGIFWYDWLRKDQLKTVVMMIRPTKVVSRMKRQKKILK